MALLLLFDYQSNRHCAKTLRPIHPSLTVFDYQSNRHCAKTLCQAVNKVCSLITSQIDTVPKLKKLPYGGSVRLITSQIDTVPKPAPNPRDKSVGLITSQIDTVPKRAMLLCNLIEFDYQSNRHCAKTAC